MQGSAHLRGRRGPSNWQRSVAGSARASGTCSSSSGWRRIHRRRGSVAGGRRRAPPFGRPTAAELAEAVRELPRPTGAVDDELRGVWKADRSDRRVSRPGWLRNALLMVERELRLGADLHRGARRRLAALGFFDDAGTGRGHPFGCTRRRMVKRRLPSRRLGPRPVVGGEPFLFADLRARFGDDHVGGAHCRGCDRRTCHDWE